MRAEIFKERNEEQKIDNCGYSELFQEALLMNKHEIVNLFLENEIDLKEFLNNSFHLFSLYESVLNRPIHLYLQRKYKKLDIFTRIVNKPNESDWDIISSKTKFSIIRKKYLNILQNDLFPFFKITLYPERLFHSNGFSKINFIEDPEFYLFFWCILTNRLETAKLFWKLGKVFILISFTIKI